jgi:PAS domain S-box-containing protein
MGVSNTGREEAEGLYHGLVECASDLITVVDEHGRFLFVNRRAMEVFGCAPEACVGRRAFDFVYPDDAERTQEWFDHCIEHHVQSGTFENRQRGEHGVVRDMLWSSVFHYDDDGNLLRIDGAGRDVSKLREAQRESEARLSLLEDAQAVARLGYFVYDVDTGTWESSGILDSILGIDSSFPRDVDGWLSLVHPDDRAAVATSIKLDIGGLDNSLENEYRIVRHSDGLVRWIHSLGRREIDAEGGVRRIIGTIKDVTERRSFEDDLRSAEAALRVHADLLEEVQEVAHLGYYDYDVVAGYWTSSLIMDSIFGIDREYERSVEGWLSIVHPDDRESMAAYLGDIFSAGAPFDRVYRIARVADGETRWVHGLGKVTYDERGVPLRMVGTIVDITERRRLEDELDRHRNRVAGLAIDVLNRSERERRMLATELHDGVAQVLAAAKIVARQVVTDAGVESGADATRLIDLLDHAISDVRLMTAELAHPVLREMGLGPALEWLTESHRKRFGLSCTLEMPEACPCRELRTPSAVVIYRAVRELLNNVHKHSGAQSAHVRVSCDEDVLVASVHDNGCGFDPAMLRAMSGAGERFGLASIGEELEIAGGHLHVESARGRGTQVHIRVPSAASLTSADTARYS